MADLPPFQKLKYLLAVARELHITKAAERLHRNQSSVSRAVRELEEEFALTVFNRARTRLVGVKEEAVPLLADIEQALARFSAELERAIKQARLRARRKASSFVIGYTPFVVPTIPNGIRSVHSRRFPSIHREMRRAPAQELMDSLIADACQVCAVLRPAGARYFEEIRLHSESLFAVWPRAYQANFSGAISLVDLSAHPLILPCSHRTDPILEQWFFDRCAAAGFKPKVAAEASTPPEAFNLVQDGVGIAIVPGGFCDDVDGAFQCSPIGGLEPLQLIITYRQEASLRVQKIIAEVARELDPAKAG
ncbi:MAG: LysR substrate-binding domain-containing protein [Terracidiphilus sp.]